MRNTTTSKRRSAAEWSKVLAAWRRSGKSVSDFALAQGIEARTLAWWRWRLKRRSRTRMARPAPQLPRLVPVELAPEVAARDDAAPSAAWELEDSRGVVLRVKTTIAAGDLDRVLGALTAR